MICAELGILVLVAAQPNEENFDCQSFIETNYVAARDVYEYSSAMAAVALYQRVAEEPRLNACAEDSQPTGKQIREVAKAQVQRLKDLAIAELIAIYPEAMRIPALAASDAVDLTSKAVPLGQFRYCPKGEEDTCYVIDQSELFVGDGTGVGRPAQPLLRAGDLVIAPKEPRLQFIPPRQQ